MSINGLSIVNCQATLISFVGYHENLRLQARCGRVDCAFIEEFLGFDLNKFFFGGRMSAWFGSHGLTVMRSVDEQRSLFNINGKYIIIRGEC